MPHQKAIVQLKNEQQQQRMKRGKKNLIKTEITVEIDGIWNSNEFVPTNWCLHFIYIMTCISRLFEQKKKRKINESMSFAIHIWGRYHTFNYEQNGLAKM